ncbi:MAG: hypothetical protein F6K48_03220 [Okeania sp. SIO3H1]|nr:hypothetical protein [Okeania sp. SIO3H1]
MRQVVTIGRLINVEIFDPKTKKVQKRTFKGKWICTSSHGKDLLICRVTGKSDKKLNPGIAARHKKFHRSGPKGSWEGELISPSGTKKQIGLLKALTYAVPGSEIRSPEKNPYHWHHNFGDTGHKGGSYPPKFFPAVFEDSKGNLFFERRPGNIFVTSDWIRG